MVLSQKNLEIWGKNQPHSPLQFHIVTSLPSCLRIPALFEDFVAWAVRAGNLYKILYYPPKKWKVKVILYEMVLELEIH